MVLPLVLSVVQAQDVPPPPKPADAGPSLADTMQFIEEKLGSIGRVGHINYWHNSISGADWLTKVETEVHSVRRSEQDCRIDYHTQESVDGKVVSDADHWFRLKYVQQVVVTTEEQRLKEYWAREGHPESIARVDPPVFHVVVDLGLQDGKANEADLNWFLDESLANRIAKALVHAVELCGGGSKEAF
jgi:hypothetical protein